mmetsp:Transcript_8833/g.21896  ORF Transcript_8833/g.21896 Transcript_8833/m.21896 type:complete len:218 (+) Transcript_8833:2842-3495(+)
MPTPTERPLLSATASISLVSGSHPRECRLAGAKTRIPPTRRRATRGRFCSPSSTRRSGCRSKCPRESRTSRTGLCFTLRSSTQATPTGTTRVAFDTSRKWCIRRLCFLRTTRWFLRRSLPYSRRARPRSRTTVPRGTLCQGPRCRSTHRKVRVRKTPLLIRWGSNRVLSLLWQLPTPWWLKTSLLMLLGGRPRVLSLSQSLSKVPTEAPPLQCLHRP